MKRTMLLVLLPIGFLLADVGKVAPAPDDPKQEPDLVKAKVDAAQATFEKYWEFYDDDRVAVDVEKIYLWSRRWMEAFSDLHEKKEDQIRAAEAHLERMKRLEVKAKRKAALGKTGKPEDVLAATFYRVEAESWLGQRKKEK